MLTIPNHILKLNKFLHKVYFPSVRPSFGQFKSLPRLKFSMNWIKTGMEMYLLLCIILLSFSEPGDLRKVKTDSDKTLRKAH